jgi:hypothetical protein
MNSENIMTEKELRERFKTLAGTEFRFEFIIDDVSVLVPAFVAQADFNVGVTIHAIIPDCIAKAVYTSTEIVAQCVINPGQCTDEYRNAITMLLMAIDSGVSTVAHRNETTQVHNDVEEVESFCPFT